MADAIFNAMGDVLTRWTMGSPAAPAARMWQAELGADPQEAELRLLALSGQFLAGAVTVEPPPALLSLPDVPVLAQPTVPDALRPLVRRLLTMPMKNELLRFIALRGWTLHPGDWMPEANDEGVPDVYAPWRDWAGLATSAKMRRVAADQITPENWDDWWPAARKVALTNLRWRDPEAGRLVLEARLGAENADARLRLLGLLEFKLSDSDAAFLEGLVATDRAPKVKALAAALLSRLNRGTAASAEDIAELKGFFSVHVKGLLRRSRVIQFENAKTPAQRQRRAALFEGVDLATFVGALGLDGAELMAAWPWNTDAEADLALIALVARTGTDALVMTIAETLVQGGVGLLHRLLVLLPRLAPSQRSQLAKAVLHNSGGSFALVRTIADGTAHMDNPLGTPAGVALLTALGQADAKPTDQAAELHALGLITDRSWARRVLDRLNAAGMVQGDPRLDMLRLNEALEDRGVTS